MTRFVRFISIIVNLAFMAFIACLIWDEAATLRWLHGLNTLWFFFGAIALIVIAAILAEWTDHKESTTSSAVQAPRPPSAQPSPLPAQPSSADSRKEAA